MNKLYLLESKEEVDYDEYAGFVIRAQDAAGARVIAADVHADEDRERWTNSKRSSCKQLTVYGGRGIILSDFRAG